MDRHARVALHARKTARASRGDDYHRFFCFWLLLEFVEVIFNSEPV